MDQCNATLCTSEAWKYPAPAKPGCGCDTTFDTFCADNAWSFYEWGMLEKRVAAVLPFFWYTEAGSVGLETLPLCRAAWENIGRKIIAAGGTHRNATARTASTVSDGECPGPTIGTPPPAEVSS